jgi:hypothetical protein
MLDPKDILKATSGDSKPKGIAKLSKIILEKSQKSLDKIAPEITSIEALFTDGCPTQDELKKIINKRNNLLSELDNTSKFIESQKQTIKSLNMAFKALETGVKTIKTTKKGISIGSKFIPSPPGVPGIIASGLSDLGDIILDIMFTPTGTPKLEKLKSQSDSLQSVIDIASNIVGQITSKLLALDTLINSCLNDKSLEITKPSKTLNSFISQTKQSTTPQTSLYRGYILKLENKKFNERLNQTRATASTRNGIVKYSTEYSFTLDPNDLINELKQTLDRIYDEPDTDENISSLINDINKESIQSKIDILEQENENLNFDAYRKTYKELNNQNPFSRIKTLESQILKRNEQLKVTLLSSDKDKLKKANEADSKTIKSIQNNYINNKINKININRAEISNLKKQLSQIK